MPTVLYKHKEEREEITMKEKLEIANNVYWWQDEDYEYLEVKGKLYKLYKYGMFVEKDVVRVFRKYLGYFNY